MLLIPRSFFENLKVRILTIYLGHEGSWKGDTSDTGVFKQLEYRGDRTDFLVWPPISLSIK